MARVTSRALVTLSCLGADLALALLARADEL